MTTRHLKVTVDGKSYDVQVDILDDDTPNRSVGAAPRAAAAVSAPAAAPARAAAAPVASGDGNVTSPLAGTVVKVHVKAGQSVQSGETVITLEAMKMNTEIAAPCAGTVQEVAVNDGSVVGEGALLVKIG
jgi:biotin carboxyl carrier protein